MIKKEIERIISNFNGKKLLLIGDVMLDEYLRGDVNRISPEAPVPVMNLQQKIYAPGGVGNVAANVASLGGEVFLGAVIGNDANGNKLKASLSSFGVKTDGLIVDPNRPTTTKTRIVVRNQQIVRVDVEQTEPLAQKLELTFLDWIAAKVEEVDVCLGSDYAKGVFSFRVTEHLVDCSWRAGKPVIIGPKGTDYRKYKGATVIVPNELEAQQALSGFGHYSHNLVNTGKLLLSMLEGSSIVITQGPKGMTVFQNHKPPLHLPAMARQVYDVVGAGDTVVSVLSMALACNASLEQAAYLANLAAGIVVGKRGTATITVKEMLNALDMMPP